MESIGHYPIWGTPVDPSLTMVPQSTWASAGIPGPVSYGQASNMKWPKPQNFGAVFP